MNVNRGKNFNLLRKMSVAGVFCMSLVISSISSAKGVSKKTAEKSKQPLWNNSVAISNFTNTIQNTYEEVRVSGLYMVAISRNLPSLNSSVGLLTGYIAGYTHRQEDTNRVGDWWDPRLFYRYNFGDSGIFKRVNIGLDGLLPLSRDSRGRDLVGSIGPSVGWGFDMGVVSLAQRLGYRYSFFTYDTSVSGQMNSPHTVNSLNDLTIRLTQNWSLGLSFTYVHSTDYEGIAISSTSTAAGINWQIAKKFGTGIGLTTLSGTLAPQGDYHRVNIYDPDRTTAYWDLSLTF